MKVVSALVAALVLPLGTVVAFSGPITSATTAIAGDQVHGKSVTGGTIDSGTHRSSGKRIKYGRYYAMRNRIKNNQRIETVNNDDATTPPSIDDTEPLSQSTVDRNINQDMTTDDLVDAIVASFAAPIRASVSYFKTHIVGVLAPDHRVSFMEWDQLNTVLMRDADSVATSAVSTCIPPSLDAFDDDFNDSEDDDNINIDNTVISGRNVRCLVDHVAHVQIASDTRKKMKQRLSKWIDTMNITQSITMPLTDSNITASTSAAIAISNSHPAIIVKKLALMHALADSLGHDASVGDFTLPIRINPQSVDGFDAKVLAGIAIDLGFADLRVPSRVLRAIFTFAYL